MLAKHLRKGNIPCYKKLYRTYKGSAKSRKISFRLSFKVFCNILNGNCFYCGIKPYSTFNVYLNKKGELYPERFIENLDLNYVKSQTIKYNGIDRVNNKNGYSVKNVVTCCKICNRAKDTMTKKEFLTWIKRVWDHQN